MNYIILGFHNVWQSQPEHVLLLKEWPVFTICDSVLLCQKSSTSQFKCNFGKTNQIPGEWRIPCRVAWHHNMFYIPEGRGCFDFGTACVCVLFSVRCVCVWFSLCVCPCVVFHFGCVSTLARVVFLLVSFLQHWFHQFFDIPLISNSSQDLWLDYSPFS